MIGKCMDVLTRFTGKPPVGWLGPGLTQTYETPEILAEAGIKYVGDWVWDDEPVKSRRRKGRSSRCPIRSRSTTSRP